MEDVASFVLSIIAAIVGIAALIIVLMSNIGQQGVIGKSGNVGVTGPIGMGGGDIGPQGITGYPGIAGTTGNTGYQGQQGPTGDINAVGPTGERGQTGAMGFTGQQGLPGLSLNNITINPILATYLKTPVTSGNNTYYENYAVIGTPVYGTGNYPWLNDTHYIFLEPGVITLHYNSNQEPKVGDSFYISNRSSTFPIYLQSKLGQGSSVTSFYVAIPTKSINSSSSPSSNYQRTGDFAKRYLTISSKECWKFTYIGNYQNYFAGLDINGCLTYMMTLYSAK